MPAISRTSAGLSVIVNDKQDALVTMYRNLWETTASPAPVCHPLDESKQADVVIIGGGFTGLSAAIHLAEAGKSVLVLEAGEPGWGASGRNGGQVNPAWRILPDDILARFGAARGQRVIAMANATCDLVFDLIDRFKIDCDALRPGYVQGAYGSSGLSIVSAWVRQWQRYGAPVQFLDRGETEQLLGTRIYAGALLDGRGGNVQPLSYARGLAHAAVALGAQIHTKTCAQRIHNEGSEWLVTTPNGTVKAACVLLCTNGYTDQTWPMLSRAVVPVSSFVAASEPLPPDLRSEILPERNAVSETRKVKSYFRLDRDGRFVIGARGNYFNLDQSGADEHLRHMACELYPALADVRWEYHWGGYVAMTPESTPKLMRLAEGVYAGLGFNGRGVAMATMMGKQLTMAALGEDPDMQITGPEIIPLHAFRQVGISWKLLTGTFLDRLKG